MRPARLAGIVGTWTPTALGSAVAGWYDVSDWTTLFQDTAGATPVTAEGQTVKRINDKSGNGRHLTNSTGWIVLRDATSWFLQMDGSSVFASGSFAWGTDKATAVWGGAQPANGNLSGISFGNPLSGTAAWEVGVSGGKAAWWRRGSGSVGAQTSATISTAPLVFGGTFDLAGATHATENINAQIAGVESATTQIFQTDTGSGNFGTQAIRIGGNIDLGTGRFYAAVACNSVLGASDLASLTTFVSARTRPGLVDAQLALRDTAAPIITSSAARGSCFSRAVFTTTATRLQIAHFNDLFASYAGFTELGVYVDGAWSSRIQPGAMGTGEAVVTLSAGSKTVAIVNGPQSRPSSAVLGTFVTKVTANAVLTPVTGAPANLVLVYGDSIAAGASAAITTQSGWVNQVRAAYSAGSVALEGHGFRSLWDDAADSTARAAFVAKMAAYFSGATGTQRIWLAIGTNDYGLSRWSAAAFGTAYAALLDDLKAALPSVSIFAQTPIVRTNETANGLGATLGDYRTQIATAQASRSSFVTLSDGTAYMTTSSLDDGVHPTTAGHNLYTTAARSALSI